MSSNNDTTDAGMVIVGVDGSQASKDAPCAGRCGMRGRPARPWTR